MLHQPHRSHSIHPQNIKEAHFAFFANDQLHKIPRPPGSLVQHPPRVLHGVTSVTEGTKKSLFIVDRLNGLGEKAWSYSVGTTSIPSWHNELQPLPVQLMIVKEQGNGHGRRKLEFWKEFQLLYEKDEKYMKIDYLTIIKYASIVILLPSLSFV